jgi:hypothetical protein
VTSPRAAWYEPSDDRIEEAAAHATCPRCGGVAEERDFDGRRLTLVCAACDEVWFESLHEHPDDRGDRLFHERYENGVLTTFRSRGVTRQ